MAIAGGAAGTRRGPGGRPMAGSSKPSMRAAFTSLKHKHYRSLWFSQAASFAGMQMQMVARGLLAYQLTGTYTAVGIVMMAWGIPQLLFSLLGGAVADRVNKRNVIIIVQTGTGVLSLLTAVLITIDLISIPWLFAMGLVQGTLFAFNMPARQALLAELVPQRDLMNAIALNNVAMNSTRIIGPMIAGILIAAWGVESAYYAQSFLYLFVLLFLFRLPPSTSHLAGSTSRGSVAAEIMIGLRYIASSRTMMLLMVMAFIPTILGMPYMTLLPGFAVDELGLQPGAYGFMFTMTGVGAIVGSIAIAGMTEFPRKPLLQFVAGVGFGAALLGLGLLSLPFGYAGALVALLGVGLFSTTYQTLNNTMIMAETKPEFYGRVMSVYMLTFSVFPLMSGPMGVVADGIGAVETFVLLGGGIVAFMVLMLIVSPRYVFSRSTPAPSGVDEDDDAAPASPAPSPPPARAPLPTAGDAAPTPALGFARASIPASSPARLAPAVARRRAPRRDYIAGTEAPLDYMRPATSGLEDAPATDGAREVASLSERRAALAGPYGLVAATGSDAGEVVEAAYGLVQDVAAPRAPVSVLRPVGVPLPSASRAVDDEVETLADDIDEPDVRVIEAGDAVAASAAPPAAPSGGASTRHGSGVGGFFPSPTERVVLPSRSFDPRPSEAPSMLVAAVTASVATAVLSWLLRGSRGS